MICKNCNELFLTKRKQICCSRKCTLEYQEKLQIEKFKDKVLGVDYIECPYCSRKTSQLTTKHLKTHGKTLSDVKIELPSAQLFAKNYLDTLSKRIAGENNPAYNHGGRLSPFSKKFHKYKSDEEATIKIRETFNKASASREANNTINTRLSYYLARGLTQDDAAAALRERQITFSKLKCISKYDEVIGLEVWKNRQLKWQNSLKSKSPEEIADINRRKSVAYKYTNINSKKNYKKTGTFYFLRYDKYYKFGLTNRNLYNRYQIEFLKECEIIINVELNRLNHCYMMESILKKKYEEFRIKKEDKLEQFGHSETLVGVNKSEIVNYITNIIDNNLIEETYNETFR